MNQEVHRDLNQATKDQLPDSFPSTVSLPSVLNLHLQQIELAISSHRPSEASVLAARTLCDSMQTIWNGTDSVPANNLSPNTPTFASIEPILESLRISSDEQEFLDIVVPLFESALELLRHKDANRDVGEVATTPVSHALKFSSGLEGDTHIMNTSFETSQSQQKSHEILPKENLRPISGFLEYLPAVERARMVRIDKLTKLYEGFGYIGINTPEVERFAVLSSKSGQQDVDKEMYVLDRATRDDSTQHNVKMGLRFDLTVPLARYVSAYSSELAFPFRRYHIGSCYRGERPQDGRFRQFIQCDVDVIGNGFLALDADIEVAEVGLRALEAMGITNYTFRASNRKLLQGILDGLSIENAGEATRILDKLQKIGPVRTLELLGTSAQLDRTVAESLLKLGSIKTSNLREITTELKSLSVANPKVQEGLFELELVHANLAKLPLNSTNRVIMDLGVIRGLDYYTGSIFEVSWDTHPNIGSIAAGGRYDNLASRFSKQQYPGVGFSLGFSRVFDKLAATRAISPGPASPSTVMVARLLNDDGLQARAIAAELRTRGIPTEVFLGNDKLGKQLKFASKIGVPFVVFDIDRTAKDMKTGIQTSEAIDLTTWMPK